MKQITAEDVRLLQKETGEGMMACKKILVERYKAEEKAEMVKSIEEIKWQLKYFSDRDVIENIVDVLDYLVRRS
jgi:hypothetical protein